MTGHESQQASLIARYEDAKTTACLLGFHLNVTRLSNSRFILADKAETIKTFSDIAHVEHFLSGVQIERDARTAARRPPSRSQ